MDTQRAAELQVLLEGVRLPASRDELVRYAAREDARAAAELEQLPDGTYERLDDVGEALAPTQPVRRDRPPPPAAESDLPPGGDDYLNPEPESGAVRRYVPKDSPPQSVRQDRPA
jgi:Protein of unknown function (DUF2795)